MNQSFRKLRKNPIYKKDEQGSEKKKTEEPVEKLEI